MAGQWPEPGGVLRGAWAVAQDVGWWAWRLDRQGGRAAADTAAHFLPVEIAEVPDRDAAGAAAVEARIEIALPDGVRVRVGRGVDGEALRRVLGALGDDHGATGVRVLGWPAPVDFRRGMDSLAALVQVTLRWIPSYVSGEDMWRRRREASNSAASVSFAVT